MAIRPTNEALSDKHFFLVTSPVPAGDVMTINASLTLQPDVVLVANVAPANLIFSVYGVEIQ
jgi:hypothetical protein